MSKCARGQNSDAHFRLFVSRIRLSTSQFPNAGPPLRDREGTVRFWRFIMSAVDEEGPSIEVVRIDRFALVLSIGMKQQKLQRIRILLEG
jgi:hypothetical protein